MPNPCRPIATNRSSRCRHRAARCSTHGLFASRVALSTACPLTSGRGLSLRPEADPSMVTCRRGRVGRGASGSCPDLHTQACSRRTRERCVETLQERRRPKAARGSRALDRPPRAPTGSWVEDGRHVHPRERLLPRLSELSPAVEHAPVARPRPRCRPGARSDPHAGMLPAAPRPADGSRSAPADSGTHAPPRRRHPRAPRARPTGARRWPVRVGLKTGLPLSPGVGEPAVREREPASDSPAACS